jgi:acyl-CoA thioesterase-2
MTHTEVSPVAPVPPIEAVYALDSIGANVWRSRTTDPRGGRMFGGTMMAQLLAAARRSTPESLTTGNFHMWFLRPADGGVPCDYLVRDLHNGKSSAVREIDVVQQGQTLAIGSVSLRAPRPGWGHETQWTAPIEPENLPRTGMPHPARAIPPGVFDIRYHDNREDGSFVRRLWFRLEGPISNASIDHECVVALISDLYFFEPIVAQHGFRGDDRSIRYATTQHSMWVYRTPDVTDWMVIESRSPVAAGGRGVVTGEIRTASGEIVASLIQEVAVRLPAAPREHATATKQPAQ